MGRDTESVIYIQCTLALEPRHFGALAGMMLISKSAKNWSGALKSLRLAQKIHPFLIERNLVPKLEQLAKDQGFQSALLAHSSALKVFDPRP